MALYNDSRNILPIKIKKKLIHIAPIFQAERRRMFIKFFEGVLVRVRHSLQTGHSLE